MSPEDRGPTTINNNMATATLSSYDGNIFSKNMEFLTGERGSVVVEAVCYKPEGRGIASR
jgi:hypothetical protein